MKRKISKIKENGKKAEKQQKKSRKKVGNGDQARKKKEMSRNKKVLEKSNKNKK